MAGVAQQGNALDAQFVGDQRLADEADYDAVRALGDQFVDGLADAGLESLSFEAEIDVADALTDKGRKQLLLLIVADQFLAVAALGHDQPEARPDPLHNSVGALCRRVADVIDFFEQGGEFRFAVNLC